MVCPKCNSENVNVQAVSDVKLVDKHKGCAWWLFVGWWWLPFKWLVLTIPALIVKIFGHKKQKIVTTTHSQAVCQNCGYSDDVQKFNPGAPVGSYYDGGQLVEQQQASPWYAQPWAAVVFSIVLLPLGLYWLWKYKHFTQNIRIGITIGACLLAIISYANCGNSGNSPALSDSDMPSASSILSTSDANSVSDVPAIIDEPMPDETVSQRNAVRAAKEYLEVMAFSHDGLVDQLVYEQYSYEDAVYGADNCGADWFEQVARSARAYLEYMAFSRQELIDQLLYEKFTQEQAEYGASAVGL